MSPTQFKTQENSLIWESFTGPSRDMYPEDEFGDESLYYDEEEDQEGLMVTVDEPEGALDAVLEPDEMETEDTGEMSELVLTDIKKLDRTTKKLLDYAQQNKLEPWMQAKIVKAAVYVADVWDQLDTEADFANDQDVDVEF